MKHAIPLHSYSQGFAICTPDRSIVGHTYRPTAREAVEVLLSSNERAGTPTWADLQSLGWSAEFVYAHVFKPVFTLSAGVPKEPETEVAA